MFDRLARSSPAGTDIGDMNAEIMRLLLPVPFPQEASGVEAAIDGRTAR
jgi:hypothetical protein